MCQENFSTYINTYIYIYLLLNWITIEIITYSHMFSLKTYILLN